MKFFILIIFASLVIGCGSSGISPAGLSIEKGDDSVIESTNICDSYYDSKEKRVVAVLSFNESTSIDDNYYTSTTYDTHSIDSLLYDGDDYYRDDYYSDDYYREGYSISGNISQANSIMFSWQISPLLDTYARNAMEDAIVGMGGATVVTRSNIEKIMQEQSFQMSIADPETMVEFGNLMGAEYLAVVSVDNVDVRYEAPIYSPRSGNSGNSTETSSIIAGFIVDLVSTVATEVYNTTKGWKVTIETTISLVDVSTGEVVHSTRQSGEANAGNDPRFNIEQITSASKVAISRSTLKAKNTFVSEFMIWGYINEIRGGKKMALMNLGSADGIVPGTIMSVYETSAMTDFKTQETKCHIIDTGVKIVVPEEHYISADNSWGVLKGNKDGKKKVGIGSIIGRSGIK